MEAVATCLVKIAERVCHSPDMLDELSKHGLIHQATHLIDLYSHTTLCQPVYTVCSSFCLFFSSSFSSSDWMSSSSKAFQGCSYLFLTLHWQGLIGLACATYFWFYHNSEDSILKDLLSTYNLSHGMASFPTVDGHSNLVNSLFLFLQKVFCLAFTSSEL